MIIPPEAVVQIANGIYEQRRQNAKVPPMCIVMTKADMARKPVSQPGEDNPLHSIKTASSSYLFASQLNDLSLIYDTCPDTDIREPLFWANNAFHEMKAQTYVSMMACSALGRLAYRYEGKTIDLDMPEYKDPVTKEPAPFIRKGIEVLWKWVLQVGGIVPIQNTKYRFPSIPSYIERYGNGQDMYRISEDELKKRIAGITRMFINVSDTDKKIFALISAPKEKTGFLNHHNDRQAQLERICHNN